MHISCAISIFPVASLCILLILSWGSGVLTLFLTLMLNVSWLIALLATMLLYGSRGLCRLGLGVEDNAPHEKI